MEFEEALGQLLRDVRLRAGQTRTECSELVPIANLSKVENGQTRLRIDRLAALCELLGVALPDLLLVVEARQSGRSVEEQIAVSNERLMELVRTGRLEPVAAGNAIRGVRGQKADSTRAAVIALQAEGLSKDEVIRKLGVGRRTVYRYWNKG